MIFATVRRKLAGRSRHGNARALYRVPRTVLVRQSYVVGVRSAMALSWRAMVLLDTRDSKHAMKYTMALP